MKKNVWARFFRLIASAGCLWAVTVSAQINVWTKITSGYWEEPYWSLGLPNSSQTVEFTSANWKALAIGANTTANYAGSLSVSNLVVDAPTNSFNQLLLNWPGLVVPLAVRSNLIIGVNGSLASHYSLLRAAYFEVNGRPTTFSDSAVAVFNQIVVGRVDSGELDLQNGSISCGRLLLGNGAQGTYQQTNGTLTATNIEVSGNGSFDWLGGAVSNSGLFTISGAGSVFVSTTNSPRFGKLQITNVPASASVDLAPPSGTTGAALLRFQDSRDIGWSGTLRILNFSTNHPGYGSDHIFIGTNSQGLTSDQLSRVIFVHPNNGSFDYSAAITPSGELVPSGVLPNDFHYTVTNGAITITGYTGPGGDVLIPSTIIGLPVTEIGDGAFNNCTNVTNVTIPNGVTIIGDDAFGGCTSLANVIIGNSVTHIGEFAFGGCTSLTNAAIGNHVNRIGYGAFSGCSGLTSITIPNSVTIIRGEAFNSCTNLVSITIPNGVTEIAEETFKWCISLTNVTIGNGVTNVGSQAFFECTSLTSVTIPSRVTSIGERAFMDCTSLNNITVDSNNPFYSSQDGVLFNKSQTTLISCPGNKAGTYNIPFGVTNIGDAAFYTCIKLTRITLPEGVTSIGPDAFAVCISLTSVTIPNSVTNIAAEAFYYCTNLNSVTIPNHLTTIADFTFERCMSLASITIPNSVVVIGNLAFYECNSLTNVLLGSSVARIGSDAFRYCISLRNITLPISVTNIGDGAFFYCTNLAAVFFEGNAPSVGRFVFDYASPTVYYLPGTIGWGPTFADRPTALWFLPNPTILDFGPSFGVQTNRFGFIISWATNVPVVVEASTNLASGQWVRIATNTLVNGSSYFSDSQWSNFRARFYRLRSP